MGLLGPKIEWSEGTTPKGKPLERKIEMPAEKVTEQDVVRFLHDAGLSHLYRTDE